MPSATRRKFSTPCLRRSRGSDVCRASATRVIASRKRGLMPSGHAAMQSPVSAQPFAQAIDEGCPSPVRRKSITPEITAIGVASPTPAGPVTGQISTHLPQRVQASSISSVRAAKAISNSVSGIVSFLLRRILPGERVPASNSIKRRRPHMAAFSETRSMRTTEPASREPEPADSSRRPSPHSRARGMGSGSRR